MHRWYGRVLKLRSVQRNISVTPYFRGHLFLFCYALCRKLASIAMSTLLVAWIKADTKAILAIHEHVITNNARLSVTHNDYNTWTLNIRGVKREDRGQYMCQVNTDPMKMQTAFLEVVIPPDIIYEETSGDMMVPEGGSAKLVCKARGYPPPKIVWRREDGGDLISRGGPQGKTKGINILYIPINAKEQSNRTISISF
ncbi:unnamed protein product [Euphydryas editha]|uniref:Ig-like domain-containing protein n=1 Tax=Euphydryas editha TaxID=104508 RepID=A0AAU9UXC6_EUPED|nr:unnamed protein product [Euphydryas editha]